MSQTNKAVRSAQAALDATATAAKDARRLSKTLPKKAAKKLRSVADEATDAARPAAKKIKANPRKVTKKALSAMAQLETAVARAEAKATKKTGKSAAKKPGKKTSDKKKSVTKQSGTGKPAAAATAPRPAASDDLSSLTLAELRQRARSEGRTGFWRLRKSELVSVLRT